MKNRFRGFFLRGPVVLLPAVLTIFVFTTCWQFVNTYVTGAGLKSPHAALDGQYASVFIPTSPMPMTGFTVFIELSRLVPLDISVDEGLRVTVSAGVLVPQAQRVEALEREFESRKAG